MTSGKITFGTDNKVKSFEFGNSGKTDLKLQAPESYPQTTAFDADSTISLANIEVAFWVAAFIKEDGTGDELGRKAVGTLKGSDITNYDAIAAEIEKALQGIVELKNSGEVKSLKVSAFVRRAGGKEAFPVDGALTIQVETETERLAIAVPADAAAPAD